MSLYCHDRFDATVRSTENPSPCADYAAMAFAFNFTPELHLRDGRIIRHLDDASDFAREQARPVVAEEGESGGPAERRRGRIRRPARLALHLLGSVITHAEDAHARP
jgi:hypothetical protein